MKIDYNELPKNFKKESFTKLEVYLRKQGSYPKDWNSTDELMLHTFLIQLEIISQHEYVDGDTDLMGLWRSNVSGCINNFWDKLDDNKKKSLRSFGCEDLTLSPGHKQSDIYTEEQFSDWVKLIACDGFNLLPSDIEIKRQEIIDKRDREEAIELRRLAKATKIAKAELRREQEILDEIEARDEAEKEANTINIVRPIKGYYKHDQ